MRFSSNTLAMMVVEEMATIAPAYSASRPVQPSTRPARPPSTIITLTCTTATKPAVPPTRTSLPMVNSSPMEKSSRTTPSSESWRTISRSATNGTGT